MRIGWLRQTPVEGICTACGAAALGALAVVDTRDVTAQPVDTCDGCGAVLFRGLRPARYVEQPAWFVTHGAEMAMGLEGGLDPLFKLDLGQVRSFLDVGCGYGWVLDYARSTRGWRVLGLDDSVQARAGRDGLGVEIMDRDLGPDVALDGAPFDLVYACEVLEHVEDPLPFLEGVRKALAPGGPFVLRTPNAAAVAPETEASALRAALSPGYHVVLYRRASLEHVLRRAGFAHVQIHESAETLMAAAADAPFAWDPSGVPDRDAMIEYLERRSHELPATSSFRTGVLYVLLKRLAFAGRLGEAEVVWERTRANLEERYGVDAADAAGLEASAPSASAGAKLPGVLCGVLLVRALIELTHRLDRPAAACFFRAATAVGRAVEARFGEVDVLEREVVNFRTFAARHAIAASFEDDPTLSLSLLERTRAESASPHVESAQVYLIAQRIGAWHLAELVADDARRARTSPLLSGAERAELDDALARAVGSA
jgi:SAM-dependent methyltransferase